MRALVAALIVVGCTPTINVTAGSASAATSTGEDPTGSTGGTAEPTSSASTGATTESPPDLPPPCPVGSEGCPCTGGGACDAGLICEASVCAPGCAVGSLGCPCTQGGGCDAGLSCSAGECVEGVSPPCERGIPMDDCCGDMVVDAYEQCDLGKYGNHDNGECTAQCKHARCGDGFLHEPIEACDGEDYCTAECTFKTCGDGTVDPWEWCEPALRPSDPECTDLCTDTRKIAFVTSEHFRGGDLGGVAGADEKCQSAAATAGLPGTFLAWIASDIATSPSMRFAGFKGPYVDTLAVQLSPTWSEFYHTPGNHAPDLNEHGLPVTESEISWLWEVPVKTNLVAWASPMEGYGPDEEGSCDGWTNTRAKGTVELLARGDDFANGAGVWFWVQWYGADCGLKAPIICVEQ